MRAAAEMALRNITDVEQEAVVVKKGGTPSLNAGLGTSIMMAPRGSDQSFFKIARFHS